MLSIVDTHQHLWDMAQFSLPWLASDGVEPLRKDHLMGDYLAAAEGANVAKTVYMEVDVIPEQRVEEAEFVIGYCARPNPDRCRRLQFSVSSFGQNTERRTTSRSAVARR